MIAPRVRIGWSYSKLVGFSLMKVWRRLNNAGGVNNIRAAAKTADAGFRVSIRRMA